MMKKAMMIGPVGAGKSTLVKVLLGVDQPVRKTQALEFHDWLIDTPGEYSENPLYYRTLMATALEAQVLLLIQDATRERSCFPFGFAQGFPMPAIGVVTKADHPDANVERAILFLRESLGEREIYVTSAATNKGIRTLFERLIEIMRD
jgi:ethanolamine utilization protein EutP